MLVLHYNQSNPVLGYREQPQHMQATFFLSVVTYSKAVAYTKTLLLQHRQAGGINRPTGDYFHLCKYVKVILLGHYCRVHENYHSYKCTCTEWMFACIHD